MLQADAWCYAGIVTVQGLLTAQGWMLGLMVSGWLVGGKKSLAVGDSLVFVTCWPKAPADWAKHDHVTKRFDLISVLRPCLGGGGFYACGLG